MTRAESRLPAGYRVRAYRDDDAAALVRIENHAAELFRAYGFPEMADNPIPDVPFFENYIAGQTVWVALDAEDVPAGFTVAGALADWLHLKELSVDPDHGRKGLGAALVGIVLAEGRARGFGEVSLTTFRDVPFNRPFYESLGFAVLPLEQASEALRLCFYSEVNSTVDPARRCLMTRRI
ncbi:MAG TPA: GNAT family N-acetyltransferase [Rhizobiaceae bacterium]|nr:GNAT family N-acetyltransferase [Rhizobiaceae bacterium]